MNMPFKIHVVVVLFAVFNFGASYSAPDNSDPELENKEKNAPSSEKLLQCYNGTYTSENILSRIFSEEKKGISVISPSFIECPNGSTSCFVSKTEGIYTFGCGGKHPEIENGTCCQYFKKIPKVPIIYFFDGRSQSRHK